MVGVGCPEGNEKVVDESNTCPEHVPDTAAQGGERKIGVARRDMVEGVEITCEVAAIHAGFR